MKSGFAQETFWYPLKVFGVEHPFFILNASTIIYTWVALAMILGICLITHFIMKQQDERSEISLEKPDFTYTAYTQYLAQSIIRSFMTLIEQSIGSFVPRYYYFISSLFLFILFCNWVALIPSIEEPTKDLNTTLALGIVALFYIQKEIIRGHSFIHYLKEYFLPISTFFPLNIIIGLCYAPFKILGELATVISLSFRLFGNIFGGAIIMKIFHDSISGSLIGQGLGMPFHLILISFFVIFEGGLQAFVFAILTLTNIGMATAREEGND